MGKRMIQVQEYKAVIIGLVLSSIFSIIISFVTAAIIINEIVNIKIDIFDLGNLFFPILFVILEMFILLFLLFVMYLVIRNRKNCFLYKQYINTKI